MVSYVHILHIFLIIQGNLEEKIEKVDTLERLEKR
jgi:hypothetical protein